MLYEDEKESKIRKARRSFIKKLIVGVTIIGCLVLFFKFYDVNKSFHERICAKYIRENIEKHNKDTFLKLQDHIEETKKILEAPQNARISEVIKAQEKINQLVEENEKLKHKIEMILHAEQELKNIEKGKREQKNTMKLLSKYL